MTEGNATLNEVKGFKELADIPARQVFTAGDNAAAAAAEYLARILKTPGANDLPMVVYGVTAEGGIDWTKYAAADIYVIMLRNKGAGYRALVVQPAPSKSTFLKSPESAHWINDILETQIAHKMMRSLRAVKGDTAAQITSDDIDAIPHTIADYVATLRLGGAVALWNKHSKRLIDALGKKVPAFASQRFTKELLRKAIESKAFATAIYPHFEERDFFTKIADSLIATGQREGSDTSLIQTWKDRRDEVSADDAGVEGLDDFEMDDLFDDES